MRDLDQLALFHRALAEFCRMGMPLGRAFREVAADLRRGRLRSAAEEMAAEVEGGAPLAEAWRKRESLFPPVYAALLEAGVASGDLPGTLEEIARHAALRGEASSRVRRAVAYPVFMLLAVSAITWFLFRVVVPQFAGIFEQTTTRGGQALELPAITRFALWLTGGGIFILPAAGILLFAVGYLRSPMDGLGMPMGLSLRLPVVGPLRLRAALLTFCGALGGLLRRGLPADRALALAAETADVPELVRAAGAAAERVRGGEGLTDALRAEGVLPSSLLWILSVAERRGEPSEGLEEVGEILHERLRWSFERYLWTVVPAFDLAMGALVLLVVLAVFLPIIQLQSALL